MFWVEPKQRTQWEMVEAIVWHTTPEMKDKKYLMCYPMTFDAFNVLVEKLTLFLKFECLNLVRPQLEVKKLVASALYKFAHGLSLKNMLDIFDMGASTIHKYVDIMCDALCNKDKLFNKYIKISTRDCLLHIIQHFEDLAGLSNRCGARNGTHIPLVERPNKRYILATIDYYNKTRFHNIVLQAVCDTQKLFWNICEGQPRGVHIGGQLKTFSLYHDLQIR